jgi:hypothetical protein
MAGMKLSAIPRICHTPCATWLFWTKHEYKFRRW